METTTFPNPHETITSQDVNYNFLDNYEGYDNPDLIADLRDDISRASVGKSKEDKNQIRKDKINKYLESRLDLDHLSEDEARVERSAARADVRHWVGIPRSKWMGDTDINGNYVLVRMTYL